MLNQDSRDLLVILVAGYDVCDHTIIQITIKINMKLWTALHILTRSALTLKLILTKHTFSESLSSLKSQNTGKFNGTSLELATKEKNIVS